MNCFKVQQAFDYNLPVERIAQRPVYPYDRAKLLVIDRGNNSLVDSHFVELPQLLRQGDLLVFNDSRVIPARLLGEFAMGRGKVEVLLLRQESKNTWCCLGKPLRKFKPGVKLLFGAGLGATVLERINANQVRLQFEVESSHLKLEECLEEVALMPIPPYIRAGLADKQDFQDYQSLFAEKPGSIAAPTASLHFTHELIEVLKRGGVAFEFVTLHIGPASFLPLWGQDQNIGVLATPPGKELYLYSELLLQRLLETRKAGGRVIAIGTTVVRALESMFRRCEEKVGENGEEGFLLETDLFIQPGYQFRMIDGLITNFHQPRTTHLLLVQALLGEKLLNQSYHYALSNDFRFLSYGDGMIIL